MRLKEFVRTARAEFDAVPEEFRRGVDGPVVVRRAKRHPYLPSYYTLGQCVPPPPPFDLGGEPLSTVVLYYGSFTACAMRDPGFDIGEEIRETIRHEIRHHLEDRAGAPDLRNEDEAEEQNERRLEGLPFHPDFYRLGEPAGERLWRVHPDLFLEVELGRRGLAEARKSGVSVRWSGETHRVAPEHLARLPAWFTVEGGAGEGDDGDLVIVVRER
jgi:predicted Zn-dependent protease with MMP-like domain